jgi:peptidoglycan endopeptidase LytE
LRTFVQRFVLSCVFVGSLYGMTTISAEAASPELVNIQVNDELIQFPDAQPFIDSNNNLQVPLRFLSEKMGYQLNWSMSGEEVEIALSSQEQAIVLRTGEEQAMVDGMPTIMDGTAVFSQGRAYVPLRFISEAAGSPLRWDEESRIAIMETDGKVHKPVLIPPSISEEIIQTAHTYIGVPYIWGGTTPRGFDCSGFVKYIFEGKGIGLPRTSQQMHAQVGTAVTELREGDLVFFASGRVNHVGIYIGDNQFISATSSQGVTIDTLSSNYWGARYVGAKRIL